MPLDHRSHGRRIILDSIRRAQPISRAHLADITGISRPTVTTVTAELLRAGLIEEVEQAGGGAQTRRGRPRVDLVLRGAAHIVAGVKVSAWAISIVLVDLGGEIKGELEVPLSAQQLSPKDFVEELTAAVSRAAEQSGYSRDDLSAVGIGIAGFVDVERSFVHWSPSLSERNVSLGGMLTERMGKPVFLDNDANLVAVAEQYFGEGRDYSDFLVVTIENGVGLGIVLDNEVYRGTRGCGTEFGHTKVQLDGALCRCGQRGCLEAYVADYALLREATVSSSLLGEGPPEQQIQNLLDAAENGEPTAQTIVNRAGRIFAMGLANLVNVFDPQLIIVSGERMQFEHLYAEEVLESISSSIVQVDAPAPKVVIHRWGDLMWARGGAAYAINGVVDMAVAEISENAK